ncbi:hypothetical protein HGRIS_006257 [Hohenbuehelia grisea]|uniref:pyridoxal 5'-phosphate synthase n=1 Tax=Hohenbuehelia grisea TaxID=104357 RepID=A0ABR3K1L2_9AGAR
MDVVIAQPAHDKIQVIQHPHYDSSVVLSPSTVLPNPLDQFRAWFTEIVSNGSVPEPEAMSLSTATASGAPSSRFVLLKQVDDRGFVFFTNYSSRKSAELSANPQAALAFYWRDVHKQVRVTGKVERVSREESEEYFHSRPEGSQLGAWASRQSSVVGEGQVQERLDKLKQRFGVSSETTASDVASSTPSFNVPVPDFWGGWRVIPEEVEFWVGKPSRLHDRVRYLRVHPTAEGGSEEPAWKIERLAP